MFVNIDGAVQSDGSLLATWIEAENPTALNVSTGPVISVDTVVPVITQYRRTQMGPLLTDFVNGQSGQYDESLYLDFSNTTFQISGQFTNLQSRPFVPSFNAANVVAGQNVDVTSGVVTFGGPTYTPANAHTDSADDQWNGAEYLNERPTHCLYHLVGELRFVPAVSGTAGSDHDPR